MSETDNGFTLMEQNQAQRWLSFNAFVFQSRALFLGATSRSETTPPSPVSSTAIYVVPDGATGAWAGRENEIAYAFGDVWNFLPPENAQGRGIYIEDEGIVIRWVPAGSPPGYVATDTVGAGTVTYAADTPADWLGGVSPDDAAAALDQLAERATRLEDGEVVQTLGDISGAVEVDLALGTYVIATITADTVITFTGEPVDLARDVVLDITENGGSPPATLTIAGALTPSGVPLEISAGGRDLYAVIVIGVGSPPTRIAVRTSAQDLG